MGIDLRSTNFTIKDGSGNTKFSTERRIPHLLYNIPGVISVPTILGPNPSAVTVERTDEFILINNNNITTNDYFVLPFFRINGGPAESGNNVLTGGGSVLLRIIRQPSTGLYLGSTILNTVVENGTLKLVCKQNLDKTGYTNIEGDDIINVAYRVYYGRFQ